MPVKALYHSEGVQEGFFVLSGECTLIVEEEERQLRQWDYFHCPAETRHVIVGAGDGPCAILMLGRASRGRDAPLSGERGRGEIRGLRREGHRRSGRGLRRLARGLRAAATAVAARFRNNLSAWRTGS
jgi:oxalate decarboxylase/phosphoglucose isomerase-like protein (cupin superfamily)